MSDRDRAGLESVARAGEVPVRGCGFPGSLPASYGIAARAGFGTTETGQQMSASAVPRMCCDADLIPVVLGGHSEVLTQLTGEGGRLQRLVSTAIWKALVARDTLPVQGLHHHRSRATPTT